MQGTASRRTRDGILMATIEPSQSIEESFGADGDAMVEVAREISKERRREVEPERP